MTTGNAFDLRPFEATVQADAAVLGVLYTGSLGRGTADRYSDLDIEVWVATSACNDPLAVAERVMGYLGTVHYMYDRREGLAFLTGFVGPDWQRVDIELHREGEAVHAGGDGTARVVKDVDGTLGRTLAQISWRPAAASWDLARAVIEEAIDSQIYASLHNARGAVWSAMGEISYRCAELYILMALLRGRQSFGFRYVEQLLSPTEQELMKEAWPRGPDRDEVRRAARALWAWTRYVWQEAETCLGRSLEIQLDDAGLRAAVERIYSPPTSSDRSRNGGHE